MLMVPEQRDESFVSGLVGIVNQQYANLTLGLMKCTEVALEGNYQMDQGD